MLSHNSVEKLFLGIDGGGSKCKAILMNEKDEVIGSGISGPGNPLHGFEQATRSIIESAKLAMKDAGLAHINLNELNAGVGLAGVNLPVLFKQMQMWQHPFKQIFLATDLLIACLGAHQGKDGAVVISGTGSCGFSYINDEEFMLGAHGFPHGDKGSGAWFGLEAVKQVLLSIDGIIEPSILNKMLLTRLDCKNDTELVEAVAGKAATYYAQLAYLVFDAAKQGDKVALGIVNEGADYINNIIRMLRKKNPPRISIIGGLTISLTPWLDKEVQTWLSKPLNEPEVGSVLFARNELAKKVELTP
jgi:glucosamine kinase